MGEEGMQWERLRNKTAPHQKQKLDSIAPPNFLPGHWKEYRILSLGILEH